MGQINMEQTTIYHTCIPKPSLFQLIKFFWSNEGNDISSPMVKLLPIDDASQLRTDSIRRLSTMQSLLEFLAENKNDDIFAIGKYIEIHIEENWQILLKKHHDKLLRAFERAGDIAYGTYLNFLFRPIHIQLKQNNLYPEPRFPGDFSISREWGNKEETNQQRWMWSTIKSTKGNSLGTIVTITFHDHNEFRIPQKPVIIDLAETNKDAVVEALSQRSMDFQNAVEFQIEYEEYLQNRS
jgi:Family of unknown function (DUF6022)